MTASFVTGGAFSLDGVHPTPRGYAYISNLFINAINAKYGATLRTVDLAQYQTLFPKTLP
jgi:phospholipase/lecithinase/hemolysin